MKVVLTPRRVASIPACSLLLNLAFWVGGAAGTNSHAQEAETPIQKVVKLLQQMLVKGRKEQDAEQVQIAAYKQFCEDTVETKKKAMADAGESIDTLKADIEKYSTDIESLKKEIADLEDDVAAVTGDITATTKVRDMEKVDYEKTFKDYSQSVDALQKAITAVKEKAIDKQQASFRQVVSLGHIPDEAKHAMVAFIQGQASPFLDQKAPEAYAYEAQSEGVIEMLQTLLDKFLVARTELEKEEKTSQNQFQLLVTDLRRQLTRDKAEATGKTQVRAKKLQSKAEAESSLKDSLKATASDRKYIDDLVVTCEEKATNFVSRQALRSDEMDAIQKAIEIISGDSVTSSAENLGLLEDDVAAEGGELSLAVLHSESQSRDRLRAASYLRSRATDIDSPVLSVLALHVGNDPLGKVKKLVYDLIIRLMSEANEEAEHKGWCDSELATNAQTRSGKTKAVQLMHSEIDSLEASIAKLKEETASLSKAVADLDAAVAKATRLRQAEQAKNQQVIEDAQAAQTAVTQALVVLKNFYAKAGEAKALLQAPPIFNKAYQGMRDESGGVIKMLEVITSDFAKLEATTKTADDAAQSEYHKFVTDSKMDSASKAKDLQHKASKQQDQVQALEQKKGDVEGTQKELDAALAYFDKLKPSCVDAGVTYEERVARRNAEVKSLQDALAILSGEDVPGI